MEDSNFDAAAVRETARPERESPPGAATGSAPLVVGVTPIHNGIDQTLPFIASIKACGYPNFKLIIVDDGSTDGSAERIRELHPDVEILRGDGNLWWSAATNLGITSALEMNCDYVLTINNDVEVDPGMLQALVDCARENPACIVGSKIMYWDDRTRLWATGGFVNWLNGRPFNLRGGEIDRGQYDRRQEVAFLTGMSVLIPRQTFDTVGLYDAENLPQYDGDTEFTLRARSRGIRVLYEPRSVVFNHVESSGLINPRMQVSWSLVSDVFTHIKSPFRWKAKWTVHARYCPWYLIPLSLGLMYLRVFYFIGRVGLRQALGRLAGKQPAA